MTMFQLSILSGVVNLVIVAIAGLCLRSQARTCDARIKFAQDEHKREMKDIDGRFAEDTHRRFLITDRFERALRRIQGECIGHANKIATKALDPNAK